MPRTLGSSNLNPEITCRRSRLQGGGFRCRRRNKIIAISAIRSAAVTSGCIEPASFRSEFLWRAFLLPYAGLLVQGVARPIVAPRPETRLRKRIRAVAE